MKISDYTFPNSTIYQAMCPTCGAIIQASINMTLGASVSDGAAAALPELAVRARFHQQQTGHDMGTADIVPGDAP